MRFERTVVRREIRGFIIDLNSSINFRSEVSLVFVEVLEFADELIERELAARPEYFNGKSAR